MVVFHFPCIEAGRVKPLCGVVHARVDWTTAPDKVTCPRCSTLLRESNGTDRLPPRGAPTPGDRATSSTR
jgi:hypothetical protein